MQGQGNWYEKPGVLDEVKKRIIAGETMGEIGKSYGITGMSISHFLRKRGITATMLKNDHEVAKMDDRRNELLPCSIPVKTQPVCREKRCYLKQKCPAFLRALELGKVTFNDKEKRRWRRQMHREIIQTI